MLNIKSPVTQVIENVLNDRAYRVVYQRLCESGGIEAQVAYIVNQPDFPLALVPATRTIWCEGSTLDMSRRMAKICRTLGNRTARVFLCVVEDLTTMTVQSLKETDQVLVVFYLPADLVERCMQAGGKLTDDAPESAYDFTG